MNNVFVNLLKFWKLTYSLFSGSITDFVWLIARYCNTFELEKHCKQYRQKCFLLRCFVVILVDSDKSIKIFN